MSNKWVTKADLWQASQARLSMSGLTIQKYSFVLQQESKENAILNKIAFTLSATGNTQSSWSVDEACGFVMFF